MTRPRMLSDDLVIVYLQEIRDGLSGLQKLVKNMREAGLRVQLTLPEGCSSFHDLEVAVSLHAPNMFTGSVRPLTGLALPSDEENER